MESPGPGRDPAVAAASPAGWRAWGDALLAFGKRRLAALGLALSLGLASALLTLLLFAYLAEEVMGRETEQLDTAVLMALRRVRSPSLDLAAGFVSALGSEVLAVLLLVLLVAFGLRRRWGAAVGLLLTVGGAQLLNNLLKDLFHRTRPAPVAGLIPAQAFSFPSGHAMVAAAFYLFLGYLAWRLLSGRARTACVAALVTLVLLIGLSRLYPGVHYLTDVAAGYAAGCTWTEAVIIGGHVLARRSPPRPAAVRGPGPDDGAPEARRGS
jgi:membrane-associated phospholipid phosphatase